MPRVTQQLSCESGTQVQSNQVLKSCSSTMPEYPNTTNSASDSKIAEAFKTAKSPSMGKTSPQYLFP